MLSERIPRRERERRVRRAEIIDAAEVVFLERGFESSSMDLVAHEAQFTKRTIYQYFASKEDLYMAVALKGLDQMFAYIKEAAARGKTGLEEVHLFGEALFGFSKANSQTFRLVNGRELLALTKSPAAPTSHLDQLRTLRQAVSKDLAETLERGKADGSIRPDLDSRQVAVSLFLLITGFFHRLSEAGDTYGSQFGFDQDSIARLTLDLIDDAIGARLCFVSRK